MPANHYKAPDKYTILRRTVDAIPPGTIFTASEIARTYKYFEPKFISGVIRAYPDVKKMGGRGDQRWMKLSRIEVAQRTFDGIITPKVLEEAEALQKQMSRISIDELYRPFTV